MERVKRVELLLTDRIRILRKHHYNAYYGTYLKSNDSARVALDNARAPRYLDEVKAYIRKRSEYNVLRELDINC